MNKNVLFLAFNGVDDDILERSEANTCGSEKKIGWLKWGTMAACFGLIFTLTMMTLPNILKGQGNIVPPPPPAPDVPGPVVNDNDNQPSDKPMSPPSEREITINWNNVAVNESAGLAPVAAPLYRDPAVYSEEILDAEGVNSYYGWAPDAVGVSDYYGWVLAPAYIPDGLTGGGKAVSGRIVREKATGNIVEDQAGRSFWVDFGEDGSPKSNDDIVIPKGFTIRVSRLCILHCCLLPVDGERTTDFGGIPVTLSHCSLPYGPFDPAQKAPNGLHNMPAGYYDIYVASFTLNGVEYEIEAQRLELEEVIKITASIINMPYSENFVVGCSQELPNKGSTPTEYPDTVIVPGFDLDEPSDPDVP